MIKKGAMFGLDARIALAIFGALSVISGAALYSAIENARAEGFRQDLEEIIKASEQYLLDNGKFIPQSNAVTLYYADLLVNRESLTTWKGPYTNGESSGSYSIHNNISNYIDKTDANLGALLLKKETWAANTSLTSCPFVTSPDCAEYIQIFFADSGDSSNPGYTQLQNLFLSLDKLVDNSDGVLSGKVRKVESGSNHYLFYQGVLRRRSM